MNAAIATIILIFITFSSNFAYSSWLCVVEKSAGVAYRPNLRTWVGGAFSPNSKKYIIRNPSAAEAKSGITSKYIMAEFGSNFAVSYCATEFNDAGVIQCGGIKRLYFNKANLRFQVIYELGYVSPLGEEGSDTPAIEIGLCSEI